MTSLVIALPASVPYVYWTGGVERRPAFVAAGALRRGVSRAEQAQT